MTDKENANGDIPESVFFHWLEVLCSGQHRTTHTPGDSVRRRWFCVSLRTLGRIDRLSPIPAWPLLSRNECGISVSCRSRYHLQSRDKTLHYQVAVTHQLAAVGSKFSSSRADRTNVKRNVKTSVGWTRTGCSSRSLVIRQKQHSQHALCSSGNGRRHLKKYRLQNNKILFILEKTNPNRYDCPL